MKRNLVIMLFHCCIYTFPLMFKVTILVNSDGVFDFCKFLFSLYTCSQFFCQHEGIYCRFQSLKLTLYLLDFDSRLTKVDQTTFELYLVLETATEVLETLKLNKFLTSLIFRHKIMHNRVICYNVLLMLYGINFK